MAINKEGNVLSIKKTGKGSLNPSVLMDMIQTAKTAGSQLLAKLDNLLNVKTEKKGLLGQ